ncbi:Atu4866 domain-containing protein [Algoriphagus sp. AGSA1]|uniref:Atu4866 domain-containing protein n=1 Tax=Algoriphagus sp. AGSA1 TaxID=2907213 RepID=UPI001F29B421|nr:Atu4866 domain-containing protein [Algoriphagus sp. AGSA1]MCE7055210.1 Atu4866 domain-containing protein [Algoriphagus sp. AGSA1]
MINSTIIKAQDVMPEEASLTPKELVAFYFDRWKNEGASFFDLLEEDAEWIVAGRSPVSGTYHGKADFMENAVKPILAQLATPLRPELVSLTADGQFVWLHFNASATTVNGQSYKNTYVWKMQLKNGKIIAGVAFLDTYELAVLMNKTKKEVTMDNTMQESGKYIGMWVTENGHIRHELLPGNRYDEARGSRKSAYQGIYKVTGNHIDYVDDTGFSADGEFIDERTLHHGGYIFYKVEE